MKASAKPKHGQPPPSEGGGTSEKRSRHGTDRNQSTPPMTPGLSGSVTASRICSIQLASAMR